MTCGCSTMGHPHTSLFLCAKFWTNDFQAAGLAMAHRHLRHHCHDHHVVLTLPHHTIHCGVLSRGEWLRVATTTTKICAELWKTPFPQLPQKCSEVCQRGHGGASICVSSIKVHIRIHWTCNQGVRKGFKSNYGSVLVSVRWLLAHYVLWCLAVTYVNAYRSTALCYCVTWQVTQIKEIRQIFGSQKNIYIYIYIYTHREAEETSRHIRVTTQAIMDNTLFGGSLWTSHLVDTKDRVAEETYGNWQGWNWALTGAATASCHHSKMR